MSDLDSLARWSRHLRVATIAALVALPVGALAMLLSDAPGFTALAASLSVPPEALAPRLAPLVLALAFAPTLVLLWVLDRMRQLFGAFAGGAVLTSQAARFIRQIGQGFLVLAILPLLTRPALTVLLTAGAEPGQRVLALGVDSRMAAFALLAGLLVVIGWAMGQAAEAAAENRAFV